MSICFTTAVITNKLCRESINHGDTFIALDDANQYHRGTGNRSTFTICNLYERYSHRTYCEECANNDGSRNFERTDPRPNLCWIYCTGSKSPHYHRATEQSQFHSRRGKRRYSPNSWQQQSTLLCSGRSSIQGKDHDSRPLGNWAI